LPVKMVKTTLLKIIIFLLVLIITFKILTPSPIYIVMENGRINIRLRNIFIYTFFDMTLIASLSFILGLLIAYYFLISETKMPIRIEEIREGKIVSWNNAVKGLDKDEIKVLKIIVEWNKIYQSELVKRTGFSKSKISRILGKLEYRGLIVRKRKGLKKIVISMVSKPRHQIMVS